MTETITLEPVTPHFPVGLSVRQPDFGDRHITNTEALGYLLGPTGLNVERVILDDQGNEKGVTPMSVVAVDAALSKRENFPASGVPGHYSDENDIEFEAAPGQIVVAMDAKNRPPYYTTLSAASVGLAAFVTKRGKETVQGWGRYAYLRLAPPQDSKDNSSAS